jgi:transposase
LHFLTDLASNPWYIFAAGSIEEQVLRNEQWKPRLAKLPRDVVEHAAPCERCPQCGGQLRPLGEDVTEVLEYVPGSFRVTRHVRPKLSCRGCEAIAQAPAPSLPSRLTAWQGISPLRGLAGPGLPAHVLVAKYRNHLPLYRQAGICARDGIDLDRSTLANWIGQTARLMRPLVAAVGAHVMAAERVHADDLQQEALGHDRQSL